MKKTVWIVPCTIALLIIWTACGKSNSSNSNNPPPSSRTILIAKATWKFDTAGIDINRDGGVDFADTTLGACFKDNTYTFNTDSTGTADNGALKCNVSDPQNFPFTWSFSNGGDSVIKSNADPILATGVHIFKMDTAKMILYKDTTVFNTPIWYVIALKH